MEVKRRPKSDPTFAAIVAHPTRVHCFFILAERTASPSEIGGEIDEDANHVAYHVKKLLEVGAIEVVDRRAAGNAGNVTKTLYRAVERPMVAGEDWTSMSKPDREAATKSVLQYHFADVAEAVGSGTYDSRLNRSLIRFPMLVDKPAFDAISELLDETYERALEIQAQSDGRRVADPDQESIPAMFTTMFFERSARKPSKSAQFERAISRLAVLISRRYTAFG